MTKMIKIGTPVFCALFALSAHGAAPAQVPAPGADACVKLTDAIPIKGQAGMPSDDSKIVAGSFPSGLLKDETAISQSILDATDDADKGLTVGNMALNKGGNSNGANMSTPSDKTWSQAYGSIQLHVSSPDADHNVQIQNGTILLSQAQVAQATIAYHQKTGSPFPPLVCGAAISADVDNGKIQHGTIVLYMMYKPGEDNVAVPIQASNDRRDNARQTIELADLQGPDGQEGQLSGQAL